MDLGAEGAAELLPFVDLPIVHDRELREVMRVLHIAEAGNAAADARSFTGEQNRRGLHPGLWITSAGPAVPLP